MWSCFASESPKKKLLLFEICPESDDSFLFQIQNPVAFADPYRF